MSCLEKQAILLFFSVSWVLVSSDIYKSVMWTTNNPLFSDSGKLSPCFGKDLEMRVHLQSSLPIVCPFDFIIMKTLPSKPATGVLYENFWIVYDNSSFLNCDIDVTYNKNGDRNKKLLECNSPEALKSFTYSIDFKAKTHANSGIAFEGGKYYYFLATSDGTDGSLNNTRGGHCNDPKVRMKFKVYICRTDVEDEKCQNVSIGEFFCPSDLPEASTPPPTTVTSTPSTVGSTPITSSAPEFGNVITVTKSSPSTLANTGMNNKTTKQPVQGKLESEDIRKELARWKAIAIGLMIFLVLLFCIIICYFIKRKKQEPGSCFTDLNNQVSPPGSQSPKSLEDKPNMKHSFNNSSYNNTDDSEDGKKGHQMSSFKLNMYGTEVDTKAQEQNSTQEKEKTHPGVNSEQIGNGTLGGKENGVKKPHVQNQKVEDQEVQSRVSGPIGNRILGGKEKGEKRLHRHEHGNRHSRVSDVVSLPPLKNEVFLKKYSPSPEKQSLSGVHLHEFHV